VIAFNDRNRETDPRHCIAVSITHVVGAVNVATDSSLPGQASFQKKTVIVCAKPV
jgi:hypothetical protein